MNGCHRFGGTETGLQTAQVIWSWDRPPGLRLSSRSASQTLLKSRETMAVDEKLIEALICLFCKGDLALKEDGSGLKCKDCRRVYPIRDNIPIMLKDEATLEA